MNQSKIDPSRMPLIHRQIREVIARGNPSEIRKLRRYIKRNVPTQATSHIYQGGRRITNWPALHEIINEAAPKREAPKVVRPRPKTGRR